MSTKSDMVIQAIKALRAAKGYSQEDMAEKLGVDLKTYSNWETGKVQMSIEKIDRIAVILNVNPSEIWDATKWVSRPTKDTYLLNKVANYLNEDSRDYKKLLDSDLKKEIAQLKEQNLALTRAYNELYEKNQSTKKVYND